MSEKRVISQETFLDMLSGIYGGKRVRMIDSSFTSYRANDICLHHTQGKYNIYEAVTDGSTFSLSDLQNTSKFTPSYIGKDASSTPTGSNDTILLGTPSVLQDLNLTQDEILSFIKVLGTSFNNRKPINLTVQSDIINDIPHDLYNATLANLALNMNLSNRGLLSSDNRRQYDEDEDKVLDYYSVNKTHVDHDIFRYWKIIEKKVDDSYYAFYEVRMRHADYNTYGRSSMRVNSKYFTNWYSEDRSNYIGNRSVSNIGYLTDVMVHELFKNDETLSQGVYAVVYFRTNGTYQIGSNYTDNAIEIVLRIINNGEFVYESFINTTNDTNKEFINYINPSGPASASYSSSSYATNHSMSSLGINSYSGLRSSYVFYDDEMGIFISNELSMIPYLISQMSVRVSMNSVKSRSRIPLLANFTYNQYATTNLKSTNRILDSIRTEFGTT